MTKLKVGMVSFAHSSHPERYLSALMRNPNVEVVGISDPDSARAAPHADRYGLPLFASHTELMDLCQAVVISSEYNTHLEIIEEAVSRDLAILCEKPLATSRAELDSIMQTVSASNVFFMVALPCRYIPAVRRAKELLTQGVIGDLVAVNATNRGACPGGWFIDPAISGGGAIMDHSAHAADLVRWLSGSQFDQLMALSGSNFLGLEIEDAGLLQFTLENGVIGVIDTSWSRQAPMPSTFDITLRLMGTHGTIWVDALSQRIEVYAGDAEWVVYGGSIDDAMVNEFVASVRDGLETPITVEDGYQASLIALAAYESIQADDFVSVTSPGL